jgi:hypothetical protein
VRCIVYEVVHNVGFALLCDEAHVPLADLHPGKLAVQACILTGASLQLQQAFPVVQHPNACERCVQMVHHGLRAGLQDALQAAVGPAGESGVDLLVHGRMAHTSFPQLLHALAVSDVTHKAC